MKFLNIFIILFNHFLYAKNVEYEYYNWGLYFNENGIIYYDAPVKNELLSEFIEITVSTCYTWIGMKSDGTVWEWGNLSNSCLALSTEKGDEFTTIPKKVNGIPKIILISAGGFAVALDENGDFWIGSNYFNRHKSNIKENYPLKIGNLKNIIKISVGKYHLLALNKDGFVFSWGENDRGQLGNGKCSNYFEKNEYKWYQVLSLKNIVDIAAGHNFSIALRKDGKVFSWGCNEVGNLGDGTGSSREIPIKVRKLSQVIAIAAGYNHCIALTKNGKVWAWGSNNYGQLGNRKRWSSSLPIEVKGLPKILAISAGNYFSLALDENGFIWAWGRNAEGELGNGAKIDAKTPVMVANLKNVVFIKAFSHASMAKIKLK